MTERATGLILRTRPFTETSLIINWITPEFGRISTVAKGARRPKSTFRGKVDLFYLGEFSFDRSRRSDLHTLREVSVLEMHGALRHELGWLQQAAYCAALIEQTTEPGTPLPEIFELLLGFLRHLPTQAPQPRNIFAFEFKLLNELGLAPDLKQARLSPATLKLVEHLRTDSWTEIAALKATSAAATEIRQFLHGFLIFHLGRIPKGRNAAIAHLSKVAAQTRPPEAS